MVMGIAEGGGGGGSWNKEENMERTWIQTVTLS